jgi:succinate dehydrogenase / fumarate reductase cytochrome b subunit
LQIYRLPMLALMSISHRITGVILSIGALLIPAVLIALLMGPEAYACIHGALSAWYGQVFLFLLSASLVYHTLAGIRHLIWDTVHHFDLPSAEAGGVIILVLTPLLTVAIWLLVLLNYGGGA